MADVFLSYAREDAARAAAIARALGDHGLSVFWDVRIRAGSSWDEVIERELRACKCVVVLWSAASVASRWVKTEARFGLTRKRAFVPAVLDSCELPVEFDSIEAAQLQTWDGNVDDLEFGNLLDGIGAHVSTLSRTPNSAPPEIASSQRLLPTVPQPQPSSVRPEIEAIDGAWNQPAATKPETSDVFFSYAHLDDAVLEEGQVGWVSNLRRALTVRLTQLLGREPAIWGDKKLQGNDLFSDGLLDRLPRAAVLVSVVSPRYIKSEWCQRELTEFTRARDQSDSNQLGRKTRVFKVVKTPVPIEQYPAPLDALLGYEFYTVDSDTGRVRELSQLSPPDFQKLYWIRLDDLAHDIADSLIKLTAPGPLPIRETTKE